MTPHPHFGGGGGMCTVDTPAGRGSERELKEMAADDPHSTGLSLLLASTRANGRTFLSTKGVATAEEALENEGNGRSRRPRRVHSDGGRQARGKKRRRRTQSSGEGRGTPGSCGSSTCPDPRVGRQGMDNQYSFLTDLTEVQYTPTMDLISGFLPTDNEMFNPPVQGAMPVSDDHPPPPSNEAEGVASGTAKKKGCARRIKNFSMKEDEILCSAYLNVSKDPIMGAYQSSTSYWSRISAYFNEHKTTPQSRSLSSLQHRWADIQKDTARFCGFFAEIDRRNQSGKSEDDKVKDALQMYKSVNGNQFRFVHCWLMLRNEPKWNNRVSRETAGASSAAAESEQGSKDATLPARIERPVGREKAKKQRSMSSSSSSSACLEVLQKMSMDRHAYEARLEAATEKEAIELATRSQMKLALQKEHLEIQRTQIKLQEKLIQLQQQEREERVMNLDLDKMAPWVREYYVKKQKEIAGVNEDGPSNRTSG